MPIDNLSKITSRSGINTTILLEAGNANVTGIVTAAGFDGPFTGGSGSDINAGMVTARDGLHVGAGGTILYALSEDDGAIGLNNTTPSTQYYNNLVVGNNNAGSWGITVRTNSANSGNLAFSDTDSANAGRYDGRVSYEHTDQSMRFHTNAAAGGTTEKLRITSDGKVGINSSTPTNTLVVQESTDNNSSIQLFRASTGGDIASINWATNQGNQAKINYRGATPSGMQFYTGGGADSDLRMLIDPDGKVGIQTNEPQVALHVFDGSSGFRLERKGTNIGYLQASISHGTPVGANNYGSVYFTLSQSTGDYVFKSSSTEIMRLEAEGKLLIGIDASTSSNGMLQSFKATGNESTIVVGNVATSAGGKCRVDFCPSNKTVGARIECHASEDFSTTANRTADLVFVTRKDGTNAEKLRINNSGHITPGTDNSQNIGSGSTNFASIWASTRFRGNDDVKLVLGNSQNLVIRHDGKENIIGSPVADNLFIKSGTLDVDDKYIASFIHTGAKVGIGTSTISSPDTKMQIFDGVGTSNYRTLAIDSHAASGSAFIYKQLGSQVIAMGSGGGNVLSGTATTEGVIRSEHATVFAVGNSEKMRIYNSGGVLIGAESGEAGGEARLAIDCQAINVFNDVGDPANYGLIFANDHTINTANGIGFFNDSASTCGGYIVHQDRGGSNIGDLIFGTASTADTPVERLRIRSTGQREIRNFHYGPWAFTNNTTKTTITVGDPGDNKFTTIKLILTLRDVSYRQGLWQGEFTIFASNATGGPGVDYKLKKIWDQEGSSNWSGATVSVSITSGGALQFTADNGHDDANGNAYIHILDVIGDIDGSTVASISS